MVKEKKNFICPDLSILEEKGKELELREGTIIKAKNLAIEYFKKTDKMPRFPEMLMPAFIYIAAICAYYEYDYDITERRTQVEIEKAFNISSSTIRKWYMHIVEELDVKITL